MLLALVDVVYVNVADDDPLFVGAKVTVNCVLWPELSVRGNDAPEIAYCELLLAAEEMGLACMWRTGDAAYDCPQFCVAKPDTAASQHIKRQKDYAHSHSPD